ncbi:(2Fe-2S) ferredoxin domain-containing protein [Martelella sp. HB161492]|uniref:(2Fe-2S) ferredoxin domain-containing protein n=1 Tax=Martelella sp. HB161492 TaxID=2720726 RepID=UPI0032B10A43
MPKVAVLLLAKAAFAQAPHSEMRALAEQVRGFEGVGQALWAFSEQGQPSLKEALETLLQQAPDEIRILPVLLPLEPSFPAWIRRSVARWQSESDRPWPAVSIAPAIGSSPEIASILGALLKQPSDPIAARPQSAPPEGSIVPAQKYRVLVCEGGACNAAGADVLWGHLRNHQHCRKLKDTGDGMMSARTTCLGPCNLAPVLQVYPDGTYYGGVTEAAIDRIIDEHVLEGRIVEDFAYRPNGRKQRLRQSD